MNVIFNSKKTSHLCMFKRSCIKSHFMFVKDTFYIKPQCAFWGWCNVCEFPIATENVFYKTCV